MIELGIRQTLTVCKVTPQGYYLTDEDKNEVLLPGAQVEDGVKISDKINVFVYRDSKDRLIATTNTPKIELHQVKRLKVVSVGKIGAFVDWGLEKDLLLPFKEQTKRVSEGEEVLVALYIDKSHRLCLTMNVYDYLQSDSSYEKDAAVKGCVYQISERFGAFVAVDDMYSGLIPAKEINSDIRIGRTIECRVVDVREDGKLTLSSLKKAYLQMDDDAKKVLSVIDEFDGVLPFSDNASPEVIKREMGMSKNAFKRAVGRLYKERKIEITEKAIRRI